ncbi:hypothetical protein AB205_0046590 [Aquarana catesbeiana]|uniref:Uncharacterized protein n=1 Tax=Aquarana catesbeiana TaxID=8400 RepID=A0A2G9RM80_AQUCT|nr:hypothetical protein AB205_0046590 [Aquarana catesbeiana]
MIPCLKCVYFHTSSFPKSPKTHSVSTCAICHHWVLRMRFGGATRSS